MSLYLHEVFMFCVISMLIYDVSCSYILKKFTNKYWFNNKELRNFGENVKGIKLTQDESRVGIINHLPEVEGYLQRELLERGARRRKNLDDQMGIASSSLETAPPSSNELLPVNSEILEDVTNSAIKERNKISDLKLVDSLYPYREIESTKKENIRKREVSDEDQESEQAYDLLRKKEGIDSSNVDIKEVKTIRKKVKTLKNEGRSKRNTNKFYDDENDEDMYDDDDYYYDDDDSPKTQIPKNPKKDKKKIHVTILYPNSKSDVSLSKCGSLSECGSDDGNELVIQREKDRLETEADSTEKHHDCKSSKHHSKNKMGVIFKTTISILAIWIVGICAAVCLLTCGCFYIYIECLADDHATKVPSSMPIKCAPECPNYVQR